MLVEYLEENFLDLRTFHHPLKVKRNWIKLAYNGFSLNSHAQSCELGEDLAVINGYCKDIQRLSEVAFEKYSAYSSNARCIIDRSEKCINYLRVWKKLLPLQHNWEEEGNAPQDSSIAQAYRFYYRTGCMAIIPYLKAATTRSIQYLPTETVGTHISQRKLAALASQCASFALLSVGVPIPTSSSPLHLCRTCQFDRDRAIHE